MQTTMAKLALQSETKPGLVACFIENGRYYTLRNIRFDKTGYGKRTGYVRFTRNGEESYCDADWIINALYVL